MKMIYSVLILLCLVINLQLTAQTIHYVTPTGAGTKDGLSWTNAYEGGQLQTAINASASGDMVWVASGTYKPTTGTDRTISFQLKEGVKVYGGFAGTETQINQRNWKTNETILSGDLNGDDVVTGSGSTLSITNNSENSYHVFYHNDLGLTSATVLDGFTITGGNAYNFGGGMINYNSSPTLENMKFIHNYAASGGGIYNDLSNCTITNSIFTQNIAIDYGGGIYNSFYSNPLLKNVAITQNTGGGIFNSINSSPTLTNVTLAGNFSTFKGGGMYNENYSSPVLNNCIIWGNTAANSGNQIYIDGSYADHTTTTLNYCCYSNSANDMVVNATGSFQYSNCITSDPLFINPALNNFRLNALSPCVDAGNNTFNTSLYDLDGYLRIMNGTINIGAYELTLMTAPGNALSFNGTNYVDIPYNCTEFTEYTIEAWIKPTSLADQTVIAANNGSGLTTAHQININGGKFQHYTYDGSTIYLTGTTTIQEGKWYHVAITAKNGGYARLYVNGVEEGTAVSVGTLENSGNRFYFGKSGFGTMPYSGSLDEVRIWNTQRQLSNIQSTMYNVVESATTGLVSYCRFDQTSGNELYNLTSGGNNGTLYSNPDWVESYAMVVPTATTETNISFTGFDVKWTAPTVGTVENYLIDVATDNAFTSPVSGSPFTVASPALTKTITGLQAGSSYYYRVRADKTSVTGQGAFSNIMSCMLPPAIPVATDATSIITTGFTANWNAVTGATGYYLDVSTDINFGAGTFVSGFESKDVANVPTYSISGLTSGTTYYYRVRAYNASGTSSNSNEISTSTMYGSGNCLSFDGVNDFVSIPHNALFNTASFSCEAWAMVTGGQGNWRSVVSERGGNAIGFVIYAANDNTWQVYFGNGTTWNVALSNVAVVPNQWTHLAITYGSNNLKFYVNGNEVVSRNWGYAQTSLPVFIGAGSNEFSPTYGSYFNGKIDEVRFWNSVRSQAQIKNNMFVHQNPATNTDLVAYYTFDQGVTCAANSGLTTLDDATSNNLNGTLNNFALNTCTSNWVVSEAITIQAPLATAATGVTATGFTANWNAVVGVTSYVIDVSTENTFTTGLLANYTNRNVSNVTSFAVTGLNIGTNYYYRIRAVSGVSVSDNSNTISTVTGMIATEATSITLNTFTANWIAVANALGYRIDVSTENTFTTGLLTNYSDLDVGNNTSLLISGLNASTMYYYRVKAYYASGTSGYSNTIYTNTTMTGSGNCLSFDGVNDYVSIPHNALFNTPSFSCEAWAMVTGGQGTFRSVVSERGGHNIGFIIYAASNNTWQVYFGNGTTWNVAISNVAIVLNQWTHLAITYGSNNLKFYVNGIKVSEITSGYVQTSLPIFIGAGSNESTPGSYFNGKIDEVRFWNSVRSQAQIQNNMFVQQDPTTNADLVAYYTFNLGTSCQANSGLTTLNDATSNNLNGTLNNFALNTCTSNWVVSEAITIQAPLATAATGVTATGFTANWNAVVGVTSYVIDVSTENTFTTGLLANYTNRNVSNVTSFAVTGLNIGTNYYYRIRAVSGVSVSDNSNTISTVTGMIATEATSITLNTFTANWIAVANALGYRIDVSTENTFTTGLLTNYSDLDVGNNTSLLISGLNASTMYYYRVKAYYASGTSGYSNTIYTNTTMTGSGNCLSFDGVNDYVSIPHNALFNTPSFSCEAWAMVTGGQGTFRSVVSERGGHNIGFIIYAASNNTWQVYFGNGTTWNVAISNVAIVLNQWTHLAITYGSNNLKFYVNGIKVSEITSGYVQTSLPIFIGAGSNESTPGSYFNGKIDEVRFWNSVRSQAQIQNNMFVQQDPTTNADLVAYYTFNLGTSCQANSGLTTLNDATSNNLDGTLNTFALNTCTSNWVESEALKPFAPVATSATLISTSGLTANWNAVIGVSGYYLDVSTDINFGASTFVAGYENKDVSNVTTYLVSGLSSGTTYYYRVRAYSASTTSVNSNTITTITIPIAPVATDATSINTTGFTANWNSVTGATGYYLDVATDENFSAGSFVTDLENKDVSNVTSYLVTGIASGTAYYYRVRAYNTSGTSTNSNEIAVSIPMTPPGNCLNFDGTTDFVSIPNNALFKTSTFSCEAWAMVSGGQGTYRAVVSERDTGPKGFIIYAANDNTWQAFIGDGSNWQTIASGKSITLNQWTHLAVTYDGITLKLYINGNFAGSINSAYVPTTLPIFIGAGSNEVSGYGVYFNGNIDEVRFWNTVRTQTDIQNNILAPISPSTTGLVAYYNFDEGVSCGTNTTVTTLYDGTSNHLNGTLNTFTLNTCASNWLTSGAFCHFPPTAIAATNIGGNQFQANWNTVFYATGYYLDVARDADFNNKVLTDYDAGNTTAYQVTGLAIGTDYYYRVRAYNGSETSENSNTISVTTLPVALNPSSGILYVKPSGSGIKDGSSWDNAYDGANFFNNVSKLQNAINNVTSGTQIWVAAGTYKPTNTSDRNIWFSLKDGVNVYGGFIGNETQLTARNWKTNETILSGDIGTIGDNSDNSYHVIFNESDYLTSATSLDGFTIRDGNANGTGNLSKGGGIYFFYSSSTINNCKVISNNATSAGGIYLSRSNSLVMNTIISGNTQGIYCGDGSPTIMNCLISGNYYSGNDASGFRLNSGQYSLSNFKIINTTISGNKSSAFFSAMDGQIMDSQMELDNCIIWNNENAEGIGTASANYSVTPSLSTITFKNSLIQNHTTADANGNLDGFAHATNSNYPKFVEPVDLSTVPTTAGDFRLYGNSPGVNTGNNSYNTLPTDIRGEARIQNTTIDMGAYEWTSGTDPDTDCTNPTAGGIIASNQTICQGSTPAEFTSVSLPSGHTGDLEFQWQESTTSAITGFSNITGANDTTYQAGALYDTTWFRRLARVSCMPDWIGCDTSNVVKITIEQTPVTGTLAKTPNVANVCEGSDVSAALTAGSGGNGVDSLAYRTHNGTAWSSWINYVSGTNISTTDKTQVEIQTLRKADYCSDASWTTVSWSIDPMTVGGSVSGGTSYCTDINSTLLTLSGQTGAVQKWQSADNLYNWSDIASVTTTTYTAVNVSSDTWYRVIVKNGLCPEKVSDSALISIGNSVAISGHVKYYNNPRTPLNGIKIMLRKDNVLTDSTITSNTGYYQFDTLQSGNYSLHLKSAHPSGQWQTWGGVNNTDWLLVSKHIAGTQLLPVNPPVVMTSASVKLTHPAINIVDANAIRQAAKFPLTGYTYFDTVKWVFSGIDAAHALTGITLDCDNVTRDIMGLCTGDVNGTYVPPSGYKTAVETLHATSLQLQHRGTLPLADEMIFPIRVDRDMELGAITLYLDFDPSVMIVTDVTMAINSGAEPWFNVKSLMFKVEDPTLNLKPETLNLKPSTLNTLQIGWMSLDPVTVAAGQAVILIHARMRDAAMANPIRFTLNENPLSELADGEGEIIDGVILMMPEAREQIAGSPAEEFILSVFPNPSNEIVNVDYLLAREEVTDFIFIDSQGFPVLKSDRMLKAAGVHRETFDVSGLIPGVYMLKATVGSAVSFRKVVVVR